MPKGFQKGHKAWNKGGTSWNKGLKGKQPWHNISGSRSGWNKGRKMDDYPQMGFQQGHGLLHKMVGKNHPRWIKDRSVLLRNERNDPVYKQWVKKVKRRDNNICRLKSKNCSGYNIVHHIKGWSLYPKLRYIIKNGITLCQAHHPRKRAEEKQLIPLFQGLVGSSV